MALERGQEKSVVVVVVTKMVKQRSFYVVGRINGFFDKVDSFIVEGSMDSSERVFVLIVKRNWLVEAVAPVTVLRVARRFAPKAVTYLLQTLRLFVAALGFLSLVDSVLKEGSKSLVGVSISFRLVPQGLNGVQFEPGFAMSFGSFGFGRRKVSGVGNPSFDAFGNASPHGFGADVVAAQS